MTKNIYGPRLAIIEGYKNVNAFAMNSLTVVKMFIEYYFNEIIE